MEIFNCFSSLPVFISTKLATDAAKWHKIDVRAVQGVHTHTHTQSKHNKVLLDVKWRASISPSTHA